MASTTSPPFPLEWTLADMLAQLGDIPAHRVVKLSSLGTATEQDVLDVQARTGRICELIDGVLVEKTMGWVESRLALVMGYYLEAFVTENKLGLVAGADGLLKILPGQVRIPDVSFIAWDHMPGRRAPQEPIPAIAPDLAVEVLSEGNTPGEMRRKLHDYFQAGVRLVWYLDPQARTLTAHTSADESTTIDAQGTIDGGTVLPGFRLTMAALFARAAGE